MHYINTTVFWWLSVWILGFALMASGWLVDVLFESYGVIPSKVLYKTGAVIVAVPVIWLLWRLSALIFSNRLAIVLALRRMAEQAQTLLEAFQSL